MENTEPVIEPLDAAVRKEMLTKRYECPVSANKPEVAFTDNDEHQKE